VEHVRRSLSSDKEIFEHAFDRTVPKRKAVKAKSGVGWP